MSTLLRPAVFALATTMVFPVFATDGSTTADSAATTNMDILRDKIRADKKVVVAANMQFTDAESKGFWPIYESYQKDLQKINDRLTNLIKNYAQAYNTGNVPNSTAKQLLDEMISIDIAEAKLKQSYAHLLGKVLPASKVARYIQIENKIRALVRFELAKGIPLAE